MNEPVVKRVGAHLMFFCPGCKYGHSFDQRWTFNGDLVRPTFEPSLLVNQHEPKARCHSFVRGGQIQFLGDCFHELRGQTVPLGPVEKWGDA
jgi:hypothetical protein